MRNFTLALALVAFLACSALVAQPYPVVDVFLDVSYPDNATITSHETRGLYGDLEDGYFAIDGLQVFGAVVDRTAYFPGPIFPEPDPSKLPLGITVSDGNELTMFASDPVWMENGFNYTFSIRCFESSDPSDYSAFSDGSYTGYFLIVDAGDANNPNGWNGLGDGSGKLLGQIIPEPATLAMLALGGVSVIRRRR